LKEIVTRCRLYLSPDCLLCCYSAFLHRDQTWPIWTGVSKSIQW